MEAIKFSKNVVTHTDCVFGKDGRSLTSILEGGNFPVIYPEDFEGSTMADKVKNANDFILQSGGGWELHFGQSSEYLINEAIVIPSNTTIYAENCTIRLADNTVDNIFRTANIEPDPEHPRGFALNKDTMPEIIKNVKLIGNNANLVQCNNTTESGMLTVGWRGVLSYLCGVDGFEVSGWNVERNLAYCFAFYGAQNGSLHDITYNTTRENGDGCDFNDAHNIAIYNLQGYTQDDTIAIGGFNSERLNVRPAERNLPITPFDYDIKPFGGDCDNIFINNVHTNGTNHVLILITGHYQIYNVTASNLSDKYNYNTGKQAIVKVYGGQYNGDYHHGLIHNCCIDNIEAYNPSKAAVWLSQGVIEDGTIRNVKVAAGKTMLSNESGVDIANYDMSVISGGTL